MAKGATKQEKIKKWKKQSLAINEQIGKELDNWTAIGMSPPQVQMDTFQMNAQIRALIDYLIEKELVVDEEFVVFLKKRLLKNLQDIRVEHIEPAARQAKMEAVRAGVEVPSLILDPSGKPIIH